MTHSTKHSFISSGFYVGCPLTALFLLVMPWMWMGVFAMILGSLASVWWEMKILKRPLSQNKAASLGFYATFSGAVMAMLIARVAGTIFSEELWRLENLYLLPPLVATKGLNFESPQEWYVWMTGIILLSIFAGAIGAPVGLAARQLFRSASN